MLVPLAINFDYVAGISLNTAIVHIPKIYQGAPYFQEIAVSIGGADRDFTGYDELKMQIRHTPTSPVLLELSKTNGTLVGLVNGIRIDFPAAVTEDLDLEISGSADIREMKFVYDLEIVDGGLVIERFSQGIGYIVENITR